jgi:hypothetical protein
VARIRPAVHGEAVGPLAELRAQASRPGDDRGHLVGPLPRGDGGADPRHAAPAGIALAVPRAVTSDGDLELDHRLEPVDVRAFEQADLDRAHGGAQDSKPGLP